MSIMQKKTWSLPTVLFALVIAAALLPGSAMAVPAITLPTAAVLAAIAIVVAFLIAVGGAILGLHFVGKSFGWAKKV